MKIRVFLWGEWWERGKKNYKSKKLSGKIFPEICIVIFFLVGGGLFQRKNWQFSKIVNIFSSINFCFADWNTKQNSKKRELRVMWIDDDDGGHLFFIFVEKSCWSGPVIYFLIFLKKKSTTLTKKEEKKSKIGYSTNKIHHFSLLPLFEFINLKKRNKSGTLYIAAHMNAAHFLLLLLFWWKIRSRFLDNNNFFWNSNDLKVEKDNNKMNWPLVHWLVENRKKTFLKLEKKIFLEINFPENFSDLKILNMVQP